MELFLLLLKGEQLLLNPLLLELMLKKALQIPFDDKRKYQSGELRSRAASLPIWLMLGNQP